MSMATAKGRRVIKIIPVNILPVNIFSVNIPSVNIFRVLSQKQKIVRAHYAFVLDFREDAVEEVVGSLITVLIYRFIC